LGKLGQVLDKYPNMNVDFAAVSISTITGDDTHSGRCMDPGLPDEVLRKIYYKNALRIMPGIDPSAFPK
jgi:hypothetical protein